MRVLLRVAAIISLASNLTVAKNSEENYNEVTDRLLFYNSKDVPKGVDTNVEGSLEQRAAISSLSKILVGSKTIRQVKAVLENNIGLRKAIETNADLNKLRTSYTKNPITLTRRDIHGATVDIGNAGGQTNSSSVAPLLILSCKLVLLATGAYKYQS